MDQHRFDAALRALQGGTTRRAGLAGALGALLGGSIASEVASKGKSQGKDDTKKTCSKTTCPDGCCSGAKCNPGTTDAACGTSGKACEKCGSGRSCQNQQCKTRPCTASSCRNGCCRGTTCVTATSASACGTGGAACARCSGATPFCSSGACVACASDAQCTGNNVDACTSGICTCASNPACSGGTPFCSSGACVACASNTDCSGGTPVCDGGSCRALAWTYRAQFGSGPANGDSNFNAPAGVVVSPDTLTAWVADYNNHRISVWTRASTSSTTWSYSAQFGTQGGGDSNFSDPSGVVVSPDTLTAWVADTSNRRIAVWTRPTTSSTTWSYSARFGANGGGDSNFSIPNGVFVSADTLTTWVADTGNSRIAVWTRLNTSSTTWSYSAKFGTNGSGDSNFSFPYGVFVSADTLTAWVADTNNNRIAIWTRQSTSSTSWSYSTQFGSSGSGDSNFKTPTGVFVSADTLTAWVADYGNNRISVWTRLNASSTTWSFSTKFGTDGSGDSNFASPKGVVVSADSRTAWVADTNNNRIAIWTLS